MLIYDVIILFFENHSQQMQNEEGRFICNFRDSIKYLFSLNLIICIKLNKKKQALIYSFLLFFLSKMSMKKLITGKNTSENHAKNI